MEANSSTVQIIMHIQMIHWSEQSWLCWFIVVLPEFAPPGCGSLANWDGAGNIRNVLNWGGWWQDWDGWENWENWGG